MHLDTKARKGELGHLAQTHTHMILEYTIDIACCVYIYSIVVYFIGIYIYIYILYYNHIFIHIIFKYEKYNS